MAISRNAVAYEVYERAIRAGKGHLTAMDEAIEAVTKPVEQQDDEPEQAAENGGGDGSG